jgi:DNA-directed RNA polymerase subunit RPC12/RpoP
MSKAPKQSYHCMNCDWEIRDTHKHLDGINCPECNGPVMPGTRYKKIIIELNGPHDPPKVKVDDEEVKVISINYLYETKTSDDFGRNHFNLVMPDKIKDNQFQTKGIAFGLT